MVFLFLPGCFTTCPGRLPSNTKQIRVIQCCQCVAHPCWVEEDRPKHERYVSLSKKIMRLHGRNNPPRILPKIVVFILEHGLLGFVSGCNLIVSNHLCPTFGFSGTRRLYAYKMYNMYRGNKHYFLIFLL